MTTPNQPGWYDDPGDSKAQRYWDGTDWTPYRQRKTLGSPSRQAAPPQPHMTPPPAMPPPAMPPPSMSASPTPWDQVRPQVDKGRRYWSGLPHQHKVVIAVGGVIVIAALIAVPVIAINFFFGGPSSSPGSGSSSFSAADKSSPSYQMGLQSGTDGYAEIQAFGAVGGSPLPYQQACQMSFDIDSSPSAGVVQRDYMAGCLDALGHQSAQWTQGRSAPR